MCNIPLRTFFPFFFCARIGCFHIQYRSSGYYNVILNWRTDVMRSRGENISLNKINLHWIMIIINSRQSNCPREGCTSHRSWKRDRLVPPSEKIALTIYWFRWRTCHIEITLSLFHVLFDIFLDCWGSNGGTSVNIDKVVPFSCIDVACKNFFEIICAYSEFMAVL